MNARILCPAALASLILSSMAFGSIEDLLRRVPDGANTVVMMDFERMLASPLAQREKWAEHPPQDFVSKPLVIPNGARKLIQAARLDPVSLASVWETSFIDMSDTPPMAEVARLRDGYSDTLADKHAVWTPLDLYFVEESESVMGVYFPADRQQTTRWIRDAARRKRAKLSPYLHPIMHGKLDHDVFVALDLEGTTDPRVLNNAIETFESLAHSSLDKPTLADTLATVKGLTLAVDIKDSPTGTLTVNFDRSLSSAKELTRPVVTEFLTRTGIEDIYRDWDMSTADGGKTIVFKGPMDTDAMRLLASLIELPAPLPDVQPPHLKPRKGDTDDGDQAASAEPPAGVNPVVYATQQHFTAVVDLIDDLSERTRKLTFADGVTMRKYARKIDRLPILDVDEDMQEFSITVAERLRESANILEEHKQTSQQRKVKEAANRTYTPRYRYYGRRGYGRYGRYYGGYPRYIGRNERKRQQFEVEEKAEGVKLVIQILKSIDDDMALVRKDMTNRYDAAF